MRCTVNLFTVMLSIVLCGLWSCTPTSYAEVDRPSGGNSAENQSIINYIDQRLESEYYWLDEVVEKRNSFNRYNSWDRYLQASLTKLETNLDDGYLNSRGERVLYSYIQRLSDSTRGQTTGFGILLHYTIVIVDSTNNLYGFIIEHIYEQSPAAAMGLQRGDIITRVDGKYIDANNYAALFESIQNNTAASLRLELRRQTDDHSFAATLDKGSYTESPVLFSQVYDVDSRKIGYLVYQSFESEYDDELMATLESLAASGAEDVILDLRCNSGGSVTTAVKLCSALVPALHEGKTLVTIKRNPKNTVSQTESTFSFTDTGTIFNLERLTVICSDNSASASELVIMGLRGIDFPVTLIGKTTQGKNCGMDVTRRWIGDLHLEYAPITFMCLNAKGFGDWGEGIEPDIDLTTDNQMGVSDKYYPIPRCAWGDDSYDIALVSALAHITGKSVKHSDTRAVPAVDDLIIGTELTHPIEGIRLYRDEEAR